MRSLLAFGGPLALVAPIGFLQDKQSLVIVIWGLTLWLVFWGRELKGLRGHVWAPPLGAVAIIVFPRLLGIESLKLPLQHIARDLSAHVSIPILILALAYLSISLDDSGFFNWCSLQILRGAKGSGPALLSLTFFGVSFLTFFTSNDIVILSMTPILIHAGRNAGIRNLTPYLLTQFIAANTASMGLFVGNPTNIVIGQAVGLGFIEYALRMILVSMVASVITFVVLWVAFKILDSRNRVPVRYEIPQTLPAWNRHMSVKTGLFLACLVAMATSSGSVFVVSVAAAACAALYDVVSDARGLSKRFGRLPFEIVAFFLSFCVLLQAATAAGLLEVPVRWLKGAFEHGPWVGAVSSGFYGIFAVNVMNNIPATILFEKLWLVQNVSAQLGAAHAQIFVDCSLFASNFGANLTVVGALAGLMWFRIIDDAKGVHGTSLSLPSRAAFSAYGAVVVLPVTILACSFIALLRS